jgi:hypothetical protein
MAVMAALGLMECVGAARAVTPPKAQDIYPACAAWAYGDPSTRTANPDSAACFGYVLAAWRAALADHSACLPQNIVAGDVMRAVVNDMAADTYVAELDADILTVAKNAIGRHWPCTTPQADRQPGETATPDASYLWSPYPTAQQPRPEAGHRFPAQRECVSAGAHGTKTCGHVVANPRGVTGLCVTDETYNRDGSTVCGVKW